jgi:hypothetical protein
LELFGETAKNRTRFTMMIKQTPETPANEMILVVPAETKFNSEPAKEIKLSATRTKARRLILT